MRTIWKKSMTVHQTYAAPPKSGSRRFPAKSSPWNIRNDAAAAISFERSETPRKGREGDPLMAGCGRLTATVFAMSTPSGPERSFGQGRDFTGSRGACPLRCDRQRRGGAVG